MPARAYSIYGATETGSPDKKGNKTEKDMTYNSLTARIRKIGAAALTVLALAFSLSSCNTIDDDYSECVITYEVRFRYDYNMKWADAFAHEVHAVALYAFDDEGRLVHTVTDTGEPPRRSRLHHESGFQSGGLRHHRMGGRTPFKLL